MISAGLQLGGRDAASSCPASAMILSAASTPMPSKVEERNCRSVRASLASSISSSPSRVISLRGRSAAVSQPDLDHKRVAAIDRRRPGGRGVELAGDQLVQPLEDQLFADGHDAIGRRGGNLASAGSPGKRRRPRAGRILCGCVARRAWPPRKSCGATAGLTRENDWMRNCPTVGALVSLSMPTRRPSSTP